MSVYGWQTILEDRTPLAEILGSLSVPAPKSMDGEDFSGTFPEMAKDMFERRLLRAAGDDPLPGYSVRAMQMERVRPLYGGLLYGKAG